MNRRPTSSHRRPAPAHVTGLAVGLAAVSMAALATAGTIRHDRGDSQHTDLAAQPQFEAFGRFENLANTNIVCSGTLITPTHVVSPAHCIDPPTTPGDLEFVIGGVTYPLSEIIVHPDWDGNVLLGTDIAIVVLSMPVTGVTPAEPYDGLSDIGAEGTIVGYGDTGTGMTGAQAGSWGTRRAGTNTMDVSGTAIGGDVKIMLCDFDNPNNVADSTMGLPTPLDLEYQAANKDSGAAVFILESRQWFVAGVVSFITDSVPADGVLANYGDRTGATRIAPHLTWINDIICPADFDDDGSVTVTDLLALLGSWGPCPPVPTPCPSDLNADGVVDVLDLLDLLGAWGQCP